MNNKPKIKHSKIKNVKFGKNVKLIEPLNIYDCEIGDNTFVGPFVEIQKNVKIGKNCRIQSHSFICELVKISDNTFISHGVVFINDKFIKGGPAKGDKKLWESTIIGKNVSIGSNATILPVSICDNVVIGAGSVVTKDISSPGFYVGNPARKIKNMTL
jgi:acetyltransferase-like isoleucine patch superfamily enzyme